MRKTLYWKFLLAYLLFGLFGFVILSTFVPQMVRDLLVKEKAASLYKEGVLLAQNYNGLSTSQNSMDSLQSQIDAIALYLGASIRVLQPGGKIILDTAQPIDPENPPEISDFDPGLWTGSFYTIGDFWSSLSSSHINALSPITSGYSIIGYISLHHPMEALEAKVNAMMQIFFMTFGAIFLLSLIILIFFTEVVYRPLRKIISATEQYASGNMRYEWSVDSGDEMGYLAAALSYMAGEIARAEDDQKRFVANISHDFRSPLTSIRGYLEAMQDGTIPTESYEKYFSILLNETQRLTKLTGSLLTLNNLNTKGMLLDKSCFDIHQSIRSTAATLEGLCSQKGITLHLRLLGRELYVFADMEKIQQVLYNLLDNAIKFSHRDASIWVETTQQKNTIFVSVKDQGIGIPKDDLKWIWDRFYKSDLSRGKDKKARAWVCLSSGKSCAATESISMSSAPRAWAANLSSPCRQPQPHLPTDSKTKSASWTGQKPLRGAYFFGRQSMAAKVSPPPPPLCHIPSCARPGPASPLCPAPSAHPDSTRPAWMVFEPPWPNPPRQTSLPAPEAGTGSNPPSSPGK